MRYMKSYPRYNLGLSTLPLGFRIYNRVTDPNINALIYGSSSNFLPRLSRVFLLGIIINREGGSYVIRLKS